MSRIEPRSRDDLSEMEPGLALVEQFMGFVPNSMLTMARVPGLAEAFGNLAQTVMGSNLVSPELRQLVAQVSSQAAGCRYCQVHTAHTAARMGVDADKLIDLWSFETSELFSDAERVALRFAMHAGSVPNAVTNDDFVELRKHYNDDQIASIVSTISVFGYLNRWNDTMGTELEDVPSQFGADTFANTEWEPGKHA